MPKARPDVARRAQRARRHDPMHRPSIEVQTPSAAQIIPALASLGTDASAPAIETGDKVWALASVSTLLVEDDAKHRQLLLDNKVIPRVLYALASDTNLEVRREASGALRNLCVGSTDDVLAQIVNKGGLETVLQVLRWAALGLQNQEQRLERARAPLLAERERLLSKPVEQMNRKERRQAAKLAQGKLPSATAGATAEFVGDDAQDTLDVHGWGHDVMTSLAAMDSAAAQCLAELCVNVVTSLACMCEASEKYVARALAWDWSEPSSPSPLVAEALSAWLCQAVHVGTLASTHAEQVPHGAECARALVQWGLASAQVLGSLTDEDTTGFARGIAGERSRTPSPAAARATPAQLLEAQKRGEGRLQQLTSAGALLRTDASPAVAMLGAAANAALVRVYTSLHDTGEGVEEDEDGPADDSLDPMCTTTSAMPLSEYVEQALVAQLGPVLVHASTSTFAGEEQHVVEVCLELAADVAGALGLVFSTRVDPDAMDDDAEVDAAARLQRFTPVAWLHSSWTEALLRLATPTDASQHTDAAGMHARAIESRALAALHNGLWRLASQAPPPPSQWPEDEEALAHIAAWRAWVGTTYLNDDEEEQGGMAGPTAAQTTLQTLWTRVFETAASWAGVESVANAPMTTPTTAMSSTSTAGSLASDGLAMVSTCLGCLWSMARILEGQLPLTQGDEIATPVQALMAAYHSAHQPAVRVQCIGTLAVLARSQWYRYETKGMTTTRPPPAYHAVYVRLATFWLEILQQGPDAETLIAVLNAIVDTYANELAPWDSVYTEAHMQAALTQRLPSITAVAKQVNRRVDAPLYAALMDSVQNLRAFLAYRASLA